MRWPALSLRSAPLWTFLLVATACSADDGELELSDIEAQIAGMDPYEFQVFKETAHDYLLGPSRAVAVLVHETAHLVEPDGTMDPHDGYDMSQTDFITDAGWFAEDGVYWERWVPEAAWLDAVYYATHDE